MAAEIIELERVKLNKDKVKKDKGVLENSAANILENEMGNFKGKFLPEVSQLEIEKKRKIQDLAKEHKVYKDIIHSLFNTAQVAKPL